MSQGYAVLGDMRASWGWVVIGKALRGSLPSLPMLTCSSPCGSSCSSLCPAPKSYSGRLLGCGRLVISIACLLVPCFSMYFMLQVSLFDCQKLFGNHKAPY